MGVSTDKLQRAWEPFMDVCRTDILYKSRIHPLPSFGGNTQNVLLKREDESGFGTSGAKKRKLASLLPYLKEQQIKHIGIIGGPRSNHVVSLLQWVREEGLMPHLFLKTAHSPAKGGNALLLDLLAEEREIQWLTNDEWPNAEKIAHRHLANLGDKGFVVPEGGFCAPAVAGLASLLIDIERNELALGERMNHICIDAGTGLTAAVLIWLNTWRQRHTNIEVVLTAGTQSSFTDALVQVREWLKVYIPSGLPQEAQNYRLHRSATAAAYGSVNASIRNAVKRYARTEGVLSDPIYT
ncbi:MAG: pyridoxal-phosphate dependent enzyme, partial [Bacteroidia bacterium]